MFVKGTVPDLPLRWTINAASREFQLSVETVRKRLIAAEEFPDEDKTYSTIQIATAVFGSLHAARLVETEERGRNWRLRNAALEGELLDKSLLTRALSSIFGAVSQIINSSPLPKQARADVLQALSTIPIAIQSVQTRQCRQIHLKPDGVPDGDGTGGEAETPQGRRKARRTKRAGIES
jgi:hypothetical protein